jgi:hypothetical protein
MVALVERGTAVALVSQIFDPVENLLKFQLSFTGTGKAIVSVTTSFLNSQETVVIRYHYASVSDELPLRDYA